MELCDRLKEARMGLHLSQDYVAKIVGVNRTAIVEIEAGKRSVKTDELRRFCALFRISADELLNGKITKTPREEFVRSFCLLDEEEQQEILNLIEFKMSLKKRGV